MDSRFPVLSGYLFSTLGVDGSEIRTSIGMLHLFKVALRASLNLFRGALGNLWCLLQSLPWGNVVSMDLFNILHRKTEELLPESSVVSMHPRALWSNNSMRYTGSRTGPYSLSKLFTPSTGNSAGLGLCADFGSSIFQLSSAFEGCCRALVISLQCVEALSVSSSCVMQEGKDCGCPVDHEIARSWSSSKLCWLIEGDGELYNWRLLSLKVKSVLKKRVVATDIKYVIVDTLHCQRAMCLVCGARGWGVGLMKILHFAIVRPSLTYYIEWINIYSGTQSLNVWIFNIKCIPKLHDRDPGDLSLEVAVR